MYQKCRVKQKLVEKSVVPRHTFLMIMIHNLKADSQEEAPIYLITLYDPKKESKLYVSRWKIKCKLRDLKTNGYNMKYLNLRERGKIF